MNSRTHFSYTIRKSMLFPLLWYVDGRCTIKIVEMADKSLYALKLEIIRISFFKYVFCKKLNRQNVKWHYSALRRPIVV